MEYWISVWHLFRKDRMAILSLALIVIMIGLALVAPWLSWVLGQSPTAYDLTAVLQPPSSHHWLGTDGAGRDVLARLIWGSRISLSVGVVSVGLSLAVGVVAGALAGYFGGWVDQVLSRVIEVVICFPTFFLILALLAFLPPSIYNIMIVIGLTGWTGVARLVRAECLKLRGLDYVQAARVAGGSHGRILLRHLLPNGLAPTLVAATFAVASAILTESALSFLGFGVQPPTPSWGQMLSESGEFIGMAWWLALFPGAAIFLTVTAYNLVGEGMRQAVDPRTRL